MNCGGLYLTPFHILTTVNCAVLLKQKTLKPIQIDRESTLNRHHAPLAMSYEDIHFNISEIYLHPSHSRRKNHRSNTNDIRSLSHNEDGKFKDIALLQITYLNQEKHHLKSIKSIQIQPLPNRRRTRQILNRNGTFVSFNTNENVLNHTIHHTSHTVLCYPNASEQFTNKKFVCGNRKEQKHQSNDLNPNTTFRYGLHPLEGFPLVVLFPKSRQRQTMAVVGTKTSKVG